MKVAIIEDIVNIAYDLKKLLNDSGKIECTQVYHNAESAIAFLKNFPADIVICDIGLPGMSGIQVISEVRACHPKTQFCMFTVFEDNQKIFESIKAGAKGYVLKNSTPESIVASILELYNGGAPMSPEIARKVIDAFAQAEVTTPPSTKHPLSEREIQILNLLSQGLLYKEIADQVGLTTGTVKQHIHRIYDRLQVTNKTEALNKYHNRN